MAGYRLVVLDAAGHIADEMELDCDHDAAAILIAEKRNERRAMELWQRVRPIRRFAARPSGAL
jgi:hypothetical protein